MQHQHSTADSNTLNELYVIIFRIISHDASLQINSLCCMKLILSFGNGNNNRNTIHSRFLWHLGYFNSPWKTKIKHFASEVLNSGDHLGRVPQWVLTMVSLLAPLQIHTNTPLTVQCYKNGNIQYIQRYIDLLKLLSSVKYYSIAFIIL